MNEDNDHSFLKRVSLVALIVVGLVSFWWLRSIWILAFASVVIAVGINVPAVWLQRHGVSRGISTVISAISVVVGVISVMVLLILPISQEVGMAITNSQAAIDNAGAIYDQWRTSVPILASILPERESSAILIQLSEVMSNVDLRTVQDAMGAVFQAGSTVLPSLIKGLGTFLAVLANLLFVILIAIFFLIEPMSYVKASLYVTPERYHDRALRVWSELYHTLSAWISTQFLSVTITMGLTWLVLGLILDIPGALTIALFAGFATFIPNIGAFLPIIPIIFFILVQDDPTRLQSTLLLRAIPAYLAIQIFESNVITPRLMRAQLDLPSGALLLFQVISATIFGALGLLLAVPILATAVTLIREIVSYDILGFRNRPIEVVTLDMDSTLGLRQWSGGEEPIDVNRDIEEPASSYMSAGNLLQTLSAFHFFRRPKNHEADFSVETEPGRDQQPHPPPFENEMEGSHIVQQEDAEISPTVDPEPPDRQG